MILGLNFSETRVSNLNVTDVKSLNPNVDEITAMCFFDPETQSLVLTCRRDRQVYLFNERTLKSTKLFKIDGGEGTVKGIQATSDGSRIITGLESGEINVWSSYEILESTSLKSEPTVDKFFNLQSWSSGNNVAAIRLNQFEENLLASGGVENPLKVWDLNTEKAVFTAKNVIF